MKQEAEALPYFEKLLQEFEKSQYLPEPTSASPN
jgi:hypothetical protein